MTHSVAPIPTLARRCVAELLGTCVLVAIGAGSVMIAASTHAYGQMGISLAFGLIVLLIVASSGHISGAHINPAVTLGFWSVGRFRSSDVIPYIAAQCAGAILGSLLCGWILGPVGGYGGTIPTLPVAWAFVIEMGYSAILAFVIMSVATNERVSAALVPVVIGVTVFVGALVTGPLTGGSFNPARSLGPALVSGNWTAHWLYWVAPIVGMVGAMRLYERLRPAARAGSAEPLGVEGPI